MDLGIRPALPIVIDCYRFSFWTSVGKFIAALKHSNRVCFVRLKIESSKLGRMAKAMQKPFPVLTYLEICSIGRTISVLSAKFLRGSAPSLERIHLQGIPFPALPKLLLSASHLVTLKLDNIPPTGYISPKAMVVGLAALHKLKTFVIDFQSAIPRSDRIHPPPPPTTRAVIPALTFFGFRGASNYLEDLVSRIDAPQLTQIRIDISNKFVDFQVAQLSKFVDRSVGLELTLFRHAHVTFSNHGVAFNISHEPRITSLFSDNPTTLISCQGIDWQVSHLAHVLSQIPATLSNVAHLDISADAFGFRLEGQDDFDWLHLLRQFPTVQTLRVHRRRFAERIALALESITAEMVAEVLPSLNSISLADQPASSIKKFLDLRQLSGRPVTFINLATVLEDSSPTWTISRCSLPVAHSRTWRFT